MIHHRRYQPPLGRKPRVLIYIEPAIYRNDPLLFAGWVTATDRWVLASQGQIEFHLLSSQRLIECARSEYFSRVSIASDALLEPFGGDKVAYMRDVCVGDELRNNVLSVALERAREITAPDIILSWSENKYLRRVFHDVPVLFTENGPLPRNGCPLVKYLDPFGHQISSAFDRLAEPAWPIASDEVEQEWLSRWLSVIAQATRRVGLDDWIARLPKTGHRVLVALQPPDWLAYEGIGPTRTSMDLLCDIASTAAAGDIIVPQWHPAQPPPPPLELSSIMARFSNILVPPPQFLVGFSDHLAPHVDEIVTLSSNVALLAPLLGKSLRVLAPSKFHALGSRARGPSDRRTDLVRFLLMRYCDPSTDWDAPLFFSRRLLETASEPEALFNAPSLSRDRALRFINPAL
jgi:hypothetical protein